VPGILWPRHATYLARFKRCAEISGYDISAPTMINARDYGVPQNRKRIFLLGCRHDLRLRVVWPPSATHFAPNSPQVRIEGQPAWETAASVFSLPIRQDDKNAIHMRHSEALIRAFESTPLNGGSRKDSGRILECHRDHNGHKDVYGRIDPSMPGPTMTTACINPSKGRFVHPTENHGITLRHAARFQSFPESFEFHGGLIAGGVQVGNAVPILLGIAVLKVIIAAIEGIPAARSTS
jgi:DNA (cytosine-5)-methyltransferase 1